MKTRMLSAMALVVALLVGCSDNPTQPSAKTLIYKDLGNVAVTVNNILDIDLTGNGTPEYTFQVTQQVVDNTVNYEFRVIPNNDNEIIRLGETAAVLESGEVIESSEQFTSSEFVLVAKSVSGDNVQWSGAWENVESRYIGIRFRFASGAFHYGWIRVTNDIPNSSLIVHDMAYSVVPGKEVKAGYIDADNPNTP